MPSKSSLSAQVSGLAASCLLLSVLFGLYLGSRCSNALCLLGSAVVPVKPAKETEVYQIWSVVPRPLLVFLSGDESEAVARTTRGCTTGRFERESSLELDPVARASLSFRRGCTAPTPGPGGRVGRANSSERLRFNE